MQKHNLTCPDFHTSPFYEDIAILLDIYQEGDSLSDMMPKISKTTCSPASPKYPLEWVATEILKPQILDTGAANLLKKLYQHLTVKHFRQIIRCLGIMSNETLKEFMLRVVSEIRVKGRTALLAKEAYDFAEETLSIYRGYLKCNDAQQHPAIKTNSEPKVLYNNEAIKLTRQILSALNGYDIIKPDKVNQNSKTLAYSFCDLDLYDSTIVFLMYWLREQGYSADDAIDHDMWLCFGLSKKDMIDRLRSPVLVKFFVSCSSFVSSFSYKYNSANAAFNRLKLVSN
ncbi:MAG: hypothetical protein J6N72_05405 [Psychrobacter sp.]|nr:hypothetical protein [Psychrobacter sp.]